MSVVSRNTEPTEDGYHPSTHPPSVGSTPTSDPFPWIPDYIIHEVHPCAWCRRSFTDELLTRLWPGNELACWPCLELYRQAQAEQGVA